MEGNRPTTFEGERPIGQFIVMRDAGLLQRARARIAVHSKRMLLTQFAGAENAGDSTMTDLRRQIAMIDV